MWLVDRHVCDEYRKLVDTPFPFPWSQLLMLQLLLFAIVMPFILSTFVDTWSLSLVFTFVTVLVYFSMLEVARYVLCVLRAQRVC